MPWVNAYRRKDGTKVKGHSRWAAGARGEMAILAVVAVIVVGGGSDAKRDDKPRPDSTAVYPVRFPGWKKDTTPKPEPSVSYPIRFTPQAGEQ